MNNTLAREDHVDWLETQLAEHAIDDIDERETWLVTAEFLRQCRARLAEAEAENQRLDDRIKLAHAVLTDQDLNEHYKIHAAIKRLEGHIRESAVNDRIVCQSCKRYFPESQTRTLDGTILCWDCWGRYWDADKGIPACEGQNDWGDIQVQERYTPHPRREGIMIESGDLIPPRAKVAVEVGTLQRQANIIADLQAENRKLRKELEFYADESNYYRGWDGMYRKAVSQVGSDNGERARRALREGE